MPQVSWPSIKEQHEWRDDTLWRHWATQGLLSSKPLSLHLWRLTDSFLFQPLFFSPPLARWLSVLCYLLVIRDSTARECGDIRHPLVDRQIHNFLLVNYHYYMFLKERNNGILYSSTPFNHSVGFRVFMLVIIFPKCHTKEFGENIN